MIESGSVPKMWARTTGWEPSRPLKARIVPWVGMTGCSGKETSAEKPPEPIRAGRQAARASASEVASSLAGATERQAGGVEVPGAVQLDRDLAQRGRRVAGQDPDLAREADRDRRVLVAGQGDRGDAAVEGDEEVAALDEVGVGERGEGRGEQGGGERRQRGPRASGPAAALAWLSRSRSSSHSLHSARRPRVRWGAWTMRSGAGSRAGRRIGASWPTFQAPPSSLIGIMYCWLWGP